MISEALRTWLLGIIAAGMLVGVLYALLPKGRMKPIAHAAGGLALLLAILQPLLSLVPERLTLRYQGYARQIEELTEEYRQADSAELAARIAESTGAYIVSKGETLGLTCTATVETQLRDGLPWPVAVTLDIPRSEALSAWISTELAIDSEHQYWCEADE